MAEKKKFYAVRAGRIPGIYTSWHDCQEQTVGFPNAIFKGFTTKEAAEAYLQDKHTQTKPAGAIEIFVDGSFNKINYSWAFAVYKEGQLIHNDSGTGNNTAAAAMNNVAGELAAAMNAIRWAEQNSIRPIIINHDYMGIAAWATGAWQAKNIFTAAYRDFAKPRTDWVHFQKVAGHTGIEGNEFVDKLAKAALDK